VVNLIDNAAKYAVGTDFVGVHLKQSADTISLDVFDHGPGIPKGQLRRIFERFYRVPSNETRRQRGSGIGLALVRHIVEGHGGTIEVTSSPNVETRFSIRLPVVNLADLGG
jgi:signal transduction histidine kinase